MQSPIEMKSKFAGVCFACGNAIQVGENILYVPGRQPQSGERKGTAKHQVCQSSPCSKEYAELDSMGALPALPDGYYTVIYEDGEKREQKVTLRLRTQRKGEWMEGRQIVARFIGGQNDDDNQYLRFGFVEGRKLFPWKSKEQFSKRAIIGAEKLLRSKSGYKEAGLLFCQESGRCCMCGKLLTNNESIEAGIGPICRKKLGV